MNPMKQNHSWHTIGYTHKICMHTMLIYLNVYVVPRDHYEINDVFDNHVLGVANLERNWNYLKTSLLKALYYSLPVLLGNITDKQWLPYGYSNETMARQNTLNCYYLKPVYLYFLDVFGNNAQVRPFIHENLTIRVQALFVRKYASNI